MKPHKTNSPKYIIARARDHRKCMTQAERILWERLKKRQVCGFRFRRQYPVERYIVDFCCPEIGLVVEVDGAVHESTQEYNGNRECDLVSAGYTVLRFTNVQIEHSLQDVIRKIIVVSVRKRE